MLSALVDKPLYQNPLAGGQQTLGGPSFRQPLEAANPLFNVSNVSNANFNVSPPGTLNVTPPSVITPRGGAAEMPQLQVYTNPVTKEILDGFSQSDFAKNVNQMQQDSRTIEINGLPITGNGSFIGNLVSYMKSVGKGDMISDNSLKQFEPLAQVSGQEGYSLLPTKPADPANLGSAGGPSIFPFPGMDSTEVASVSPETLGGGINNLPEFGRPPSMFSNTEGIGSLIGFEPIDQTFNSQQAFNQQRFNEYVDSLVNERLKDFFGGIMGAIDV